MPDQVDHERGDGEAAVFVSYAREDSEFVHDLGDALAARGHPVWLDERGIRPTAAWMEEVRTAIEAAPAVVFVVSPASADSLVCREEALHAAELGKRILPVMRGEVDADQLPDAVASRHWVPARPGEDLGRAAGELSRALDTEPEWAAEHTRYLRRAVEWDRNGRDTSFVLRGRDLTAAERWLTAADERKDPRPSRMHTEYLLASRRAATRGLRLRMAILAVGLVLAVGLAVFALIQKGEADRRAREARSRELAARALLEEPAAPDVGLLLALEAARADATPEAEVAMRQLLPESHAAGALSGGGAITAATLSPDGRLAATAGEDGNARIWRLATGKILQRLRVTAGRVTDVAFSGDGSELLTTGGSGTIVLWRVGSGTRIRSFHGLGGVVRSADFSPDGRLVVAGGVRGARLWSVQGRPLARAAGPASGRRPEPVWSVAFSPDTRAVALAGIHGLVRIWELEAGGERRLDVAAEPSSHPDVDVYSAEFSPDGRLVLTSSEDGYARIWDLAKNRVTDVLPVGSRVNSASFSPSGGRVVTAGANGEARVWDTTRAKRGLVPRTVRRPPLLRVLHAPGGEVLSASFGPDDHTLITAESGGIARIWDTNGYDRVREFREFAQPVVGADFSRDGRVTTSNATSLVRVWNLAGGPLHPLQEFPDSSGVVWSVEFDNGGSRVVTASNDGTARVWNPVSGETVVLPVGAKTYSATFSPDGSKVATGDVEGRVEVWNIDRRARVLEFRADAKEVDDVAFSPEGGTLATAGTEGAALWDASGQLLHRLGGEERDAVRDVAFSPDGAIVATAGIDRTVRLWDADSGRQVQILRGATKGLESVAFSPDGGEVAAAGEDAMVRVWDLASHQLLDGIRGPVETIHTIAFSPDGRSILAASEDGSAYLMRCGLCLPTARIEAIAAAKVNAALTPAERARYVEEAAG